jgi:aspartate carbamoyltransferase catalytic subunit
MRHHVRAVDLSDTEVDRVLQRAAELAGGPAPQPRRGVLGCLFLTASMRTKIGYQVAAHRLGLSAVCVDELRVDATMSSAESYEDALRVLSGMVDVVVTRTPFALAPNHLAPVRCPVINGGDAVEHPTQALIDLAAMRRFRGEVADLHVGLCGDLGMRSASSLLSLLARRPPAQLTLVYPDGRAPAVADDLGWAHRGELSDCKSFDILLMVGLPPRTGEQHLDAGARQPYILTDSLIDQMPDDAIVLCPMPVVDEIATAVKGDRRMRMYDQSDHAVFVRMAVLERLLGG